MASGTFLRLADLVVGFAAVTGRRLPTITLPAQTLLPVARVARLMQHVTPVHIPVEFEGAYLCRCANRCDDTKTRQELGVTPCDLEVTLADSVRWLSPTATSPASKPASSPPPDCADMLCL
jgi:nucleoside-diphosphate-sugar epimerase